MSSWLSGLANKAEDMLNSVDKAAAVTLTKIPDDESSAAKDTWQPSAVTTSASAYLSQTSSTSRPPKPVVSSKSASTVMTSSASVPSNLNRMSSGNGGEQQPPAGGAMSRSMHAGSSSKKKDVDEELFEFLNSPNTKDSGNGAGGVGVASATQPRVSASRLSGVGLANGHSRQSSSSSVGSQRNCATRTPEAPTVISQSDISDVQGNALDTPDGHAAEDGRGSPKAPIMAAMDHHHENSSTLPQNESSLELENQLLKNEISSLNQEMTSVIRRAKESQDELIRVRRKLDAHSTQHLKQDSMVRELQARESDLTEALSAKDSQLAVLRVRFEEGEKALEGLKRAKDLLEQERYRILNDHTSVSGAQNQALDGLKQKLADAEEALHREKDSYGKAQQEAMDRLNKKEIELGSVAESLKSAERRATSEKARCSEMSIKLKTLKAHADSAKQELSDYKDKAGRILQSKDRLILSLKEGAGESGEAGGVSAVELEDVRAERDILRDEVQQNRATIESLRTEIQDLELSQQTDQTEAVDAQNYVTEQLDAERARREEAEQELGRHRQELQYAQEELVNQKAGHHRQVQDRDAEIDRLRNQLMTKSVSSNSQTELENRLHTLTESLIHKQTVVEALSTEKNSLVLQLERLEQQHKLLQETTQRVNMTSVPMHDDEVRQRIPGFLRESPLDGDVTRRVKRAANNIDKFSVRLGVFLRRYPVARVFVICYMALLHLWVMVVLLTYQPEMHGHDFNPHE